MIKISIVLLSFCATFQSGINFDRLRLKKTDEFSSNYYLDSLSSCTVWIDSLRLQEEIIKNPFIPEKDLLVTKNYKFNIKKEKFFKNNAIKTLKFRYILPLTVSYLTYSPSGYYLEFKPRTKLKYDSLNVMKIIIEVSKQENIENRIIKKNVITDLYLDSLKSYFMANHNYEDIEISGILLDRSRIKIKDAVLFLKKNNIRSDDVMFILYKKEGRGTYAIFNLANGKCIKESIGEVSLNKELSILE